jgi:hypothetical protein
MVTANSLWWVETGVMWAFYLLPLLCLILWPRVTLFFFGGMILWWVSKSGDDTVWLFALGIGALLLHFLRNIVMEAFHRLPGARQHGRN